MALRSKLIRRDRALFSPVNCFLKTHLFDA
jgi:hypothetical protein